jgi:hypothetical protein
MRYVYPLWNKFAVDLEIEQLQNFEDAESLYTHHLLAFEEYLEEHLKTYYTDIHLTLLVALLDFVCTQRYFEVGSAEIIKEGINLDLLLPLNPVFQLSNWNLELKGSQRQSVGNGSSTPAFARCELQSMYFESKVVRNT